MAAAGTNGARAGSIAWPPARWRANWARIRRSGTRAAAGGDGGESKMDYWDRMELKFGRLLGEEPKLTLAKVRAILFFFLQFSAAVLVAIIEEVAFAVIWNYLLYKVCNFGCSGIPCFGRAG